MKFQNVAVIGANGFIGSHITKKLLTTEGLNISIFGRGEKSKFDVRVPYKQLNLLDRDQINEYFSDIELIYYLASETIPSTSWEDPKVEIGGNLLPFLTFLECVVKLSAKKVVFVSSAGTIYGPTNEKVSENSDKAPFSPYGIVKLTMEYFLNYFNRKYGINFDTYRVSNVYGEGQDTSKGLGIINTFLEKILREGKIQIFGDGEATRNYLYVEDLATILQFSVSNNTEKSDIYNATSHDTLTINQLVSVIKKMVPEKFEVNYTATRQSDNSAIYIDNSKLLSAHPTFRLTTIEQGIAKTYDHIKKTLRP